MNVYRVTIVKPNGKFKKYYTRWFEATNQKSLRKMVLKKIKDTQWNLVGIYFERPATHIEPERNRKNYYRNH